MSTGREKDQKDFDLEQIVEIFDAALESDDQRIKDALRALLTITVLCTAERPQEKIMGPFERMLDDMRNLNRRLSTMEDELNRLKWDNQRKQTEPFMPTVTPFGPNPNTGWPGTSQPWTGTNPNGPKPMWGPSYTSAGDDPGYTGAKADAYPNLKKVGVTQLAEDFLRELESK